MYAIAAVVATARRGAGGRNRLKEFVIARLDPIGQLCCIMVILRRFLRR